MIFLKPTENRKWTPAKIWLSINSPYMMIILRLLLMANQEYSSNRPGGVVAGHETCS